MGLEKCKETPRGSGFSWGEGRRGSVSVGFIGQTETRGSRRETQGRAVSSLYISRLSFLFSAPLYFKACCPERSETHQSPYTSGREPETPEEPNSGWKCQQHAQPREDLAHISRRNQIYIPTSWVCQVFPIYVTAPETEGGFECEASQQLTSESEWEESTCRRKTFQSQEQKEPDVHSQIFLLSSHGRWWTTNVPWFFQSTSQT